MGCPLHIVQWQCGGLMGLVEKWVWVLGDLMARVCVLLTDILRREHALINIWFR